MIFQYDKKNIRYERYGKGPVMVLLHGFLETLDMWEPLMPFLTDRYEVIRIDLPGHGESDVFDDVHSMEFMAGVVDALLEYLGVREFHIVGHSMGGYVSLAFAESFPNRLLSITLLNSTTKADDPQRRENRKRALKVVEENPALFIRTSILNLFSPANQSSLKGRIEMYQSIALNMNRIGIQAAIRGMMARTDKTRVLSAFKGKKIWVCGKQDPLISENQCIKLSAKTRSRLFSVEGGHMLVEENQREIVKIMHFIE